MPSDIPVVILLTRERAGSFRRCVNILADALKDGSMFGVQEAFVLIDDLTVSRAARLSFDTPIMALEWALQWANKAPPPPVPSLREARSLLEAAAADWADGLLLLRQLSKRRIDMHGTRWPDLFDESARTAASESLRIQQVLRTNWPVDSKEEEEKALAQIKAGGGIGLEDAFAQIAGLSKEDFQRKVEAHKRKK